VPKPAGAVTAFITIGYKIPSFLFCANLAVVQRLSVIAKHLFYSLFKKICGSQYFHFTISGFGWGVFERIKTASPKAIPLFFTHKFFRRAYFIYNANQTPVKLELESAVFFEFLCRQIKGRREKIIQAADTKQEAYLLK